MGKEARDLSGQTRGRWLVLEYAGRNKKRQDLWRCKCSCQLGTERIVLGYMLRNEKSQSCGCLKRERASERFTSHGLCKSNPRLYESVRKHFQFLRDGGHGYQYWTLDPRYPDNSEGVVMFCMDVIALYPEECARYEVDKSLDLDKDNNDERIFRPEDCRFVSRKANNNNRRNTIRLDDGTPLAMFCSEVGIVTWENGKDTKVYGRIAAMYRDYHKPHPELLQAANERIALYKKTLDLLKLQEEVRRFASKVQNLP